MPQGSPVRRRHLVSQLKRLRSKAGLSQEQVSQSMGWESGKIIRIEAGRFIRLNSADVAELCRLYDASDSLREELVAIAKASRQEKPWWFQYKDVNVGAYYGLEHEAAKVQEYSVGLIPGLFQHPDYVDALLARGFVHDLDERRRRVEARLQRHHNVLERAAPPRIWTILDESSLRSQIGSDEVMNAQYQHLLQLGEMPTVDIQVLQQAAGMSGNYSFSILTFDESDRAVYIDVPPHGVFFEDQADLLEHERTFEHLQAAALSPAQSKQFLKRLTTASEGAS